MTYCCNSKNQIYGNNGRSTGRKMSNMHFCDTTNFFLNSETCMYTQNFQLKDLTLYKTKIKLIEITDKNEILTTLIKQKHQRSWQL